MVEGVSVMLAEATDTTGQPWWLVVAGIVGTIVVALIAARGPVWAEKIKERRHANPSSPAEKIAGAEDVLREWLKATIRERDRALREVDRLEKHVDVLEKELYRLGWDGRTA